MQRLLSFPLKDSRSIQKLRRTAKAAVSDSGKQVALALALSRSGCSYEAASILRPLRSYWKSSENAQLARDAVEAQAWWTKNWRDFVRLTHSGRSNDALALLADRVTLLWDLPPLLVHLGEMAQANGQLDLAVHLFQRVSYLAERGLPAMNMQPFAYVARAAIADVVCMQGDAAAALKHHKTIIPNPGNAMAHELQHARLLVLAGRLDEAMRSAASILVTAKRHRTGYSRDLRLEFIRLSSDIAPLRGRSDWKILLQDPETYLRKAQKQK